MCERNSYRSRRGSFGTSRPSTHTSPRSGSSNPTMCLIAHLTATLTSTAHPRPNYRECMLAAGGEAEIQSQYFRFVGRQFAAPLLNSIIEEAIHCYLCGVRPLVSDEPLNERAITFGI